MWWQYSLKCPICGSEMKREEKSLICVGGKRHCFDLAAQGYVNLASSRAAGGGDDAALIRARTAFLSAGHYAPFAERIVALLKEHAKGDRVVDAGCGEGYYTCRVAQSGFYVYGFDLSKRGVREGAKNATRIGANAFFGVAGIFDLPLKDESADAVISLFAPIAEHEFLRVLRPGGILIAAGAGEDHLLSLKRVLYDTPRKNDLRADLPHGMEPLHSETLAFTMHLSREDAANLFAMTPYYYRTSLLGKEALAALPSLECEAEMDIRVYRKG
ncbi:MAG: methyltransferase domain-containing protein [Ruminococcaceae bacterium]|nr:methyltransferase domain-containing protein [Oscillospiraceae bacterium]